MCLIVDKQKTSALLPGERATRRGYKVFLRRGSRLTSLVCGEVYSIGRPTVANGTALDTARLTLHGVPDRIEGHAIHCFEKLRDARECAARGAYRVVVEVVAIDVVALGHQDFHPKIKQFTARAVVPVRIIPARRRGK